MAQTLRDRYGDGLVALGYTRDFNARTGKYHVYVKDGKFNVYLGKSGAVRYGRTASNSRALGSKGKQQIMAAR